MFITAVKLDVLTTVSMKSPLIFETASLKELQTAWFFSLEVAPSLQQVQIACVKTNVKNYFQLSKALNLIRILLLSISPAVGEIPENARQAGHCGGDGERKSSAERVCVWWHKGKRLFKGNAPYSDLSHVHFIKCDVFCCLVNPEKRGLLSAASANEKQTLRKAWTRHDHSVCWHLEHG